MPPFDRDAYKGGWRHCIDLMVFLHCTGKNPAQIAKNINALGIKQIEGVRIDGLPSGYTPQVALQGPHVAAILARIGVRPQDKLGNAARWARYLGFLARCPTNSRPIDMGGPRNRWLEYRIEDAHKP